MLERKPVAPSLHSDPAFSTNPQAHPYAVTSHEPWLSSPPVGHPTLKSKSRRRPDDTASDSEPFHIPPPNSPVNFADGPQDSTTFAVPNDVPDTVDIGVPSLGPHSLSSTSTTAAEPVSKSHQGPYLSPSPPLPTTGSPATPKRRLTLMTLLKRRSYQQPQPSASANPKPQKALTSSKSVSNRSDVTHPPISLRDIERQLFPPRPVTLASSTSPVVPMPPTGRPTPKRPATDILTNRYENLDRIDELDETNPWGIALHHGGPYEAAVQAIRGKETVVFPGRGSYNQGLPQTHDNNYLPPQATGLSLNLSPGQILPRNYHPHHTPPSQPVQNSMPPAPTAVMMKPPGPAKTTHPQSQPSRMVLPMPMQSSATLPVSSRRQSYQTPSRDFQTRRQSFNPTPTTSQLNLYTPSPLSSSSSMHPQQHLPHRIPAASQPSPNPPVETHHNLPNRVTDDVSPMISIGIGMAMLGDESDDEESEESSSSAPSQPSTTPGGRHPRPTTLNPAVLRQTPPERTQPENPRIVTTPQEVTSSSLSTQPRKTTLEEMLDLPLESPPPYTSPVHPKDLGHFQAVVPPQLSSTSSIQGLGSSVPRREVIPMHTNSQAAFVSTRPPPRASSVRNQPAFRSDVPRSYPPSRNSPERTGFEDTHSVHPSVSSKSSSSRSSGPPSSRRVPKHLVMPAPLAQSNVGSQQYQNRPPPAQLPPRRPTRHSLPHPVLSPGPMPSAQIFVKAQAQEIHFASSKACKLQKKVSLIGSTSHPPVVTTVSFAPPIIGFNHSVGEEDDLRHMVTEKLVQKRVLSKRKNW